MLQFLKSPAIAVSDNKLIGKMFDNLFAIFGTSIVQHIFLNSHTNMPIHTTRLGIDIYCHTITRIFNNGTHIIIE